MPSLFKTENCIVKIKTGEFAYKYATINKVEAYKESEGVADFKIDIRFTIRTDDSNFDFGCGEAAVYDSDSKIIEDEGKLLREAKEAVNNLLFSCNAEDDNLCYSGIVQIAGKSRRTSACALILLGLY